jgi:hypothetical protein
MNDIKEVNEKKIEKSQTPVEKFWSNFEKSVNVDSTEKAKREAKIADWWDTLVNDNNEKNLTEDEKIKDKFEFPSSYEERKLHTPREGDRGQWEDERGESKYIPADSEIRNILKQHGLDGINYKDGIPDFSKVSESTVEIDNMTGNRQKNFEQCDEKCAEQWNKEERDGRIDWTARDVADWRREFGYSWHERNDMKTCDLIPAKINTYFGHLGGVGEIKIRNSKDGGFDE